MLRLERVVKSFGDQRAVDQVSLIVPPGQLLGVIGRSGAGKSTLLRMINRLVDPTAGTICSTGRRHALRGRALRDWRARCAMIFQQFNLVGRLDVLTNVLMGRLNQVPPGRALLKLWTDEENAHRALGARAVRHRAPRRPARRHAVGRPAAARRHRPRPGAGARRHPRRRADRLARSAQHPGGDGCAAAHQPALRHHGDLQSALARSRAQLLRPPGRHVRRQRGVRRRAGGADRRTSRATSTASKPAR